MRGKSHTQGGSLTDSRLDHVVSFPVRADRCAPDSPSTAAGPGQVPGDGPPTAVDGGRLLVVPGTTESTVLFLHGAGTGTDTPLFVQLAAYLTSVGVQVARLEMPYRVAGRRAPDRPARLDAVAIAAVGALGPPRLLAFAGASMGSWVAVRVAAGLEACGVLALGFPIQPPGTTPAGRTRPSRQDELDGAGVPVLVVQGERDSFGRPVPDPELGREVHLVAGADHSFRTRRQDARPPGEAVAEAARAGAFWLRGRLRESSAG